jgi:hypothetical protein
MMMKNGPQAIKEFTMLAYNQFGMCVVVLVAFVDTEGDPSITLGSSIYSHMLLTISSSFNYNNINGGTSFNSHHQNRRQYQMVEDFSKWGFESLGKSLFCPREND